MKLVAIYWFPQKITGQWNLAIGFSSFRWWYIRVYNFVWIDGPNKYLQPYTHLINVVLLVILFCITNTGFYIELFHIFHTLRKMLTILEGRTLIFILHILILRNVWTIVLCAILNIIMEKSEQETLIHLNILINFYIPY